MLRTLRTSAVILAALPAAVIELCLVCRVCGLGCCSFCFGSVCFPFVFPLCCGVFLLFFLFMSSGEGETEAVLLSVVVIALPLSLLYYVFSLLCTCMLTTSTTAATVLKVCGYCK